VTVPLGCTHTETGARVTESVTITDNRTGESIEIPIVNGGIDAGQFQKLLPGVWFFDPAFGATAGAASSITELDGENGILRYRGYPIEQLAEHSTYLEVAYLLVHGELPTPEQFDSWKYEITHHTFIHENVRKRFMEGFHHDAHPMGMLVSAIAALSTFYPEAKDIDDPDVRMKQIVRLIAKVPTLAAGAHRFSVGQPFVYPDNTLDFPANFLSMMWKIAEPHYEADPVLTRALDILFILHADHEQNCSTTAMRTVGSAHADPYSATAAAAAALYGPRHGGANEAVIRMLQEIGSYENVEDYVKSVKAGERRLQGFGHRVYKSYDPRASIIKRTADQVFEVTGKNPLLDIALKLEEVALNDEYFVSRRLYPNVDFYSGLIYQSMGFPLTMFTVLFAIPRTSGWLAHWLESLEQNSRIIRPRQLYVGPEKRDYVPLDQRG
jgi:citrate synthase